MPSNSAIRRLSIEAFRGFRDRRDFDLSASAIVITGPNGTGKTSFFDAVQWALIGRIERLEDLRARRNVEHIVNQYRLGERAVVEMEFVVGDTVWLLRRTGDYRGTTLELRGADPEPLFGDEAEITLRRLLVSDESLSLEMALATSGLLQQDVMRATLEAKPADRYKHLSTILGLAELEDFEEAVREASREASGVARGARADADAASRAVESARSGVQRMQDQQMVRPSVESTRAEVDAVLDDVASVLRFDRESITSPKRVTEAVREVSRFQEHVRSLMTRLMSLRTRRTELLPEPVEGELVAARQVEAEANAIEVQLAREVDAARSSLVTTERTSEEIVRLASLAIPMLTDHCPVCGQTIDPEHVAAELRQRAGESEALTAARDSLSQAISGLEVARRDVVDAKARGDDLERRRVAWADVTTTTADLAAAVAAAGPGRGIIWLVARDLEEFEAHASAIVHACDRLRRLLADMIDVIEQGSTAVTIQRASAEVESLVNAHQVRENRWQELATRAASIEALTSAVVDARIEVTERRFNAIRPLVADIYGRLDPHPAFKAIEFELDTYYRRGATTPVVRDLLENVSADPLVIFSTSQANIAALSYFLAIGWTVGDRRLPFVLLDDPLQSMDDVNVLGFADLCRHVRESRQLFISTHERRFASLLERKLAPRADVGSTIVLHFEGWDRSGPSVERSLIVPERLEPEIRLVRSAAN